MEIKFYWNGSFAGISYYMTVNDNQIGIGSLDLSEDEAKLKAVKILKQDYDIDYDIDGIKFEWGGEL